MIADSCLLSGGGICSPQRTVFISPEKMVLGQTFLTVFISQRIVSITPIIAVIREPMRSELLLVKVGLIATILLLMCTFCI